LYAFLDMILKVGPALSWSLGVYKVFTSAEPVVEFAPRFVVVEEFKAHDAHVVRQIYPKPTAGDPRPKRRRRFRASLHESHKGDCVATFALRHAMLADGINPDPDEPAEAVDEPPIVEAVVDEPAEPLEIDILALACERFAARRRRKAAPRVERDAADVVPAPEVDEAEAEAVDSISSSDSSSTSSSSSSSTSSSVSSAGAGAFAAVIVPAVAPIVEAAPLADVGAALAGPRRKGIIVAFGPNGSTITAYPHLEIFVAMCRADGHGGRCRLTKSSRAHASIARKPAQGRPLGELAAWIQEGSDYPSANEHLRECKPGGIQRYAARLDLAGEPASAALFAEERVRREGEGSEPEELA
jgi:hypothetical protein